MHRRYGLLILLTAVIVLSSAYFGYMAFNASGLPLGVQIVDARTGIIQSLPGVALPDTVHAGERFDLAAQPRATRIAIAELNPNGQPLPRGSVYDFVLHRGASTAAVPVESISMEGNPSQGEQGWLELFEALLTGAIALTAVWRGRDRPAAGLALFATAFPAGRAVTSIPCAGAAGLAAVLGAWALYLAARAGFYVMAESVAGAALSERGRSWWRTGFLLLLVAGGMITMGGPLVYVNTGWAELLRPGYGLVTTASYAVSVVLLFASYHRAQAAQRLRQRWMLWSSALFVLGIAMGNTPLPGVTAGANAIAQELLQGLALAGLLYAILRHRVVDLAVVFSRTLVYAMTTSLVLGLFALLESLIERAALGHRASLMLELAVPLGLGMSLSTVHRRIDDMVDRLIFRRQHREEVALRSFAAESAFVANPETLLDMVVDQLHLQVGARWVALYEHTHGGYTRTRQRGERDLPQTVAMDDGALLKLRAHGSEVDLHSSPSALGRDGHVFPLRSRDHLLGVVVVGSRPGEHYSREERELLAHVAHAVGASLFALKARFTEEQLTAARAEIEASAARLDAARAQARVNDALLSDARARESALLDALRALGSAPRLPVE